ncbi:MAG: MIP/aquaporin family protein [Pseudomonadota bacterium]
MSNPPNLNRRLAAEALGTAFLLMGVVGSGIMAVNLSGGNTGFALLANAVSTGTLLTVLIWVFGPLSGAHFNPAVTLAFAIRREIDRRDAVFYVITQAGAGIIGVWLAHVMFAHRLFEVSETVRTGIGQFVAEGIATFGLVGLILALVRLAPSRIAAAVGLYITSAYWFTASTSFANPAVTIARSLTNSFAGISPPDVLGFIISQLTGAVLAVFVFGWLVPPTDQSGTGTT